MVYLQASIRLGCTDASMRALRGQLRDEMSAQGRPGHHFLVRHADGAVYATATDDGGGGLGRTLEALEVARGRLRAAGTLDAEAELDVVGPPTVRAAFSAL